METHNRDQAAEMLALEALTYLAGSEADLTRFMNESGIDPDALRARASERTVLRSVLDFLLAEDTRLLAFCETAGVEPNQVHVARHVLDGAT